MSIPTPAPFMAVYPQSVRPVANVTPFTYRDGLSYLNLLESLIDYVNDKLVGYIQLSMDDIVQQLNTSIEELSQQITSNEVEYNKLLDDYMSSVEYRIMEINNKSGQLPIRRYQVTDDMTVDVEPVWPDRQQIILQFTQDYLGHDVEFKSTNAAPSPLPDATNGWTSTSSQWWPGHPDINAGRRPHTNGYVTRRDISGPSSVISRIENIGGINIPSRHGREHTVSVYTHCTTTDDYTVQLHVSTDVENFDSPKLAATVDEQGWARTVYTFTIPTTTDVLNVSAQVDVPGESVGGEEVWWTDAQVEEGGAPTAYRGVFANPHDISVSRETLATTQIDCTPQPDGTWLLESVRAAIDNMREEITRIIAEIRAELSDTLDTVREEIDGVTGGGIIVNALQFPGVDPTGKTDSADGLQAAIDASVGGRLILPRGIYEISHVIYMRSHVIIEGNECRIRRSEGYEGTIFGWYFEGDHATTAYNGIRNVKISGVIIDGGPNKKSAGNLVSVNHANDVSFYKCRFERCTGYHHLEVNCSKDVDIDSCWFNGHVFMESIGWRKEAIQIDCSNPGSIGSGARDGLPARNVTIRNCFFGPDGFGNPAPPIMVGSHATPNSGQNYDNITVENCIGDGVTLAGVWVLSWQNSTIKNNVIKLSKTVPSGADLGATRYGVRLHTSPRVVVEGNNIYHTSGWDRSMGVSANESSTRAKIINNYTEYSQYGYNCRNSDAVQIQNNQCWRTQSYGIFTEYSSGTLITSNLVQSANYPNGGVGAIRIGDDDSASSVITNQIYGTGKNDTPVGISLAGGANNPWIFGNRLRGYEKVSEGSINGGNNSLT